MTYRVKDEMTYRALRREGNSEEKSARIANAAAGTARKSVARRGGCSEIGIGGRSSMSEAQLVTAPRGH